MEKKKPNTVQTYGINCGEDTHKVLKQYSLNYRIPLYEVVNTIVEFFKNAVDIAKDTGVANEDMLEFVDELRYSETFEIELNAQAEDFVINKKDNQL